MTSIMEMCSSAIRGVIVAPPEKKLVIADLSNIEGRVLAWLAGESWKLQAFRDFDTITGYTDLGKAIRKGHDLYNLTYAKAFGISVEMVDSEMRQVGKVMELALGYAGGVGAFLTFALAYSIDLEAMAENAIDAIPDETLTEASSFLEWQVGQGKGQFGLSDEAFIVCDSFKRLWREAHPAVSTWWKELEEVCVRAINNPGETFRSRMLKIRRDGQWLRIGLPTGRCLCYPSPQATDDGKLSYMGINHYSRKWERLRTYGGKLVENVAQGVARDVLAYRMPDIEQAGYEIVLTVHDEIIAEAPDTDEFTHGHLAELMATNPDWSEGLPLAAAGFEAYRYRKG